MTAYWQRGGACPKNFGDALNPVLLEALFRIRVCHYDDLPFWRRPGAQVLFAAGSILERNKRSHRHLRCRIHVWGTGTRGQKPLEHLRSAHIHAVRGPLTRQRLQAAGVSCPEVFGDPATLTPRILPYALGGVGNGPVAVIPHYVDRDRCRQMLADQSGSGSAWTIIDVADDLESIVQQITRSRAVLSSSLHGLIVADAYRVPNARIRFGSEISGGDFKFDDYALSVGRRAGDVTDVLDLARLQAAEQRSALGDVAALAALADAFPGELLRR